MSRSYKKNNYDDERPLKMKKSNRPNYDDDYNFNKHKKKKSYDISEEEEVYITYEEYHQGRIMTWEKKYKEKNIPCPSDDEIKRDYYKLIRGK